MWRFSWDGFHFVVAALWNTSYSRLCIWRLAVYPIQHTHDIDVLCFIVVISYVLWIYVKHLRICSMSASLVLGHSYAWWRHQMETFSALLVLGAGNSPVPGEFPAQRPVTRSFDVLFDLRPNRRLSKQWWGWWFETPSIPLWRHCNWL